jgi:type I restriction enzyme S subunit
MTSKKQRKVPELRFRGFTDDWEQRKLGTVSSIRTGPFGSTLHAEDYVEEGIPIVTTEHFKNGSLPIKPFGLPQVSSEDYQRLKSYKLQSGDIVFSRVGSIDINAEVLKFQEGWLFSGRVLRVRPNKQIQSTYLHYVLSTGAVKQTIRSRAVGQTMPSINTQILKNTRIVISPIFEEQDQIARLLETVDNTIALHQRKQNLLEKLKQGYLQKLFPQKGQRQPELRFPGFTDDWEQRKLKTLFKKSREKNIGLQFDRDAVLTAATMQDTTREITSADDYMRTYNVIHIGDLLFEGHTSKKFAYGRFVLNDYRDGIVSHVFDVYRPVERMEKEFLKYYMHSERIMRPILVKSTSNARMLNSLNAKEFGKQLINLPSISEQQQIGQLLDRLQTVVALHQQEIDRLQQLKQGYLQKMFV